MISTPGEILTFVLTVSDGTDSAPDEVAVFVENLNHLPAANAGIDQTKNENVVVTLDGTASSDPDDDTITYTWTQIAGPTVALSNTTSSAPTFIAPSIGSGGALLTFQLIAHDGLTSSTPDEVNIAILNTNDSPACDLAQASQTTLWSPDHKMVIIGITVITDTNNDTR